MNARYPSIAYRTLLYLLLSLILLGTLLVLPASQAQIRGQLQYTESTYTVGVGDVLSVNVYNQPDLSHDKILVRPDGNASFNGIGEVHVAGKTLKEVNWLVESQMRELLVEPRVSVSVTEARSPSVYLAGAVMRPGMFQMAGAAASAGDTVSGSASVPNPNRMDFRLSSVLANAGGVKLNADISNIMISRKGQPYKNVNLWHMLQTGSAEDDLILQSGDSIYIPALPELALNDAQYSLLLSSSIGPKTFPVRIIGEVNTPGVYSLDATSPMLNTAIAKSGGFKQGANRKVVALRRFSAEDKFSTVFIDPNAHDFMLRPNDVVFVSELKIYKTGRFAEVVSKVLSPFTNVASAFFGMAVLSGL